MKQLVILLLLLIYEVVTNDIKDCSPINQECYNIDQRFLFYNVNPAEGFNLRRDVYLRFAVFAHKFQKSENPLVNNFKMILPPWTSLPHWKSRYVVFPWSVFFDISSLQKFAPIIDMHQLFEVINKYTKPTIDEVYILQNFDEMFKTGKFEEKMSVEECNPIVNNFHFHNFTSDNIQCVSFHGHVSQLISLLKTSNAKTILIDRAEIALHDSFGDKIYWQARRSMRFNKQLLEIAKEFRKTYLDSNDDKDNTILPSDWRDEKPRRNAQGGPFLSVHLRRGDFARSRPKDVPTIPQAATQLKMLMKKLNLLKIFIATDAAYNEYQELEDLLNEYEVFRFVATIEQREKYGDGGIAILDQIICSYASFFIGTYESTFSFRIQEEREILGFPTDRTFNVLCGLKCSKPSVWNIVY